MTVLRMDHVGVTVDDLGEGIAFFTELGLECEGRMTIESPLADRIIALDDARSEVAMMRTPDGHGCVELVEFHTPPIAGDEHRALVNTRGLRHLCFAVDDLEATLAGLRAHGGELVGQVVDYEGSYKLCYVWGPSGIIVELAQKLG
jgi:catechol 2,3-dioxygenase-like lactoylglutathione lyase family enzyme